MSEQNKQKVNWGDFTPVSEVKKNNAVDWDQFTPVEKDSEQGNFSRGFETAMRQVPQTIGGVIGLAGCCWQ